MFEIMKYFLFVNLLIAAWSQTTNIDDNTLSENEDSETVVPQSGRSFFLFGAIIRRIREKWLGYSEPAYAGPGFPLGGYYNCPVFGCRPSYPNYPPPQSPLPPPSPPVPLYPQNNPYYPPIQPGLSQQSQQQQQQSNVVIYHNEQNGQNSPGLQSSQGYPTGPMNYGSGLPPPPPLPPTGYDNGNYFPSDRGSTNSFPPQPLPTGNGPLQCNNGPYPCPLNG